MEFCDGLFQDLILTFSIEHVVVDELNELVKIKKKMARGVVIYLSGQNFHQP